MPETTIEVGAFLAGILPKDETTLLIVSMCVLAVGMTVSCVFAQKKRLSSGIAMVKS